MISLVPILPEWIRFALSLVLVVTFAMAFWHMLIIGRKPQSRALTWVLVAAMAYCLAGGIFHMFAGRPLVELWPEGAERICPTMVDLVGSAFVPESCP